MKIKLAILDHDENYLNRISTIFSAKYSDKLEIYAFTDLAAAEDNLLASGVNVFLAGDSFEINTSRIPAKCSFAYLVDFAGIDEVNGEKAICKYQKIDVIYKQILSLYSDNNSAVFAGEGDNGDSKVIFFSSPCGGTGTSTMAAACALRFAGEGRQVLYLNLEKLGASDVFFDGEGQGNIGDVIYAVKSHKANISLKIESCVRRDVRGVYYYASSKIALDMLELTGEETKELINELKVHSHYDYIIVDTDFKIDKETVDIFCQGSALVWVGDGSESSNSKITRAYNALSVWEQGGAFSLTDRICLIYNKFSNKTGQVAGVNIRNIGGTPRIEHATSAQILERLSVLKLFDQIVRN